MICLDTMVLIRGIQGVSRPGEDEAISRATRYLQSLDEEGDRVMVPALVVMEYLAGLDAGGREVFAVEIERRFYVPAFDLECAHVAADLWAAKLERDDKTGGHGDGASNRHCVKTDCAIIATAIVHGARLIITDEDTVFTRLAMGRVKARPVPRVDHQAGLL